MGAASKPDETGKEPCGAGATGGSPRKRLGDSCFIRRNTADSPSRVCASAAQKTKEKFFSEILG